LNPPPPQPDYQAKLRQDEQAEFTFITCGAEMEAQYQVVATKVISKLATRISLREIAIITGSNDEANRMAEVLKENSIPYYLVKWDFDPRSDVVQWLIQCAHWCVAPGEISFNNLARFWNHLLSVHTDKRIYLSEIQRLCEFHEVLLEAKEKNELSRWLTHLIETLNLEELLDTSERYPDERENLERLLQEAKDGGLSKFDVKKFAFLGTPDEEVTVITRHSVKGLEFEAVIMLGLEEGRFPYYKYSSGSREMKEAHRLCYVCVSRAKKVCILLRSEIITLNTKNGPWKKPYTASRFWQALHKKFGSKKNTFTSETYS
jgi:DNA helicase-2/ATP-dependent DNA helicase PcrA